MKKISIVVPFRTNAIVHLEDCTFFNLNYDFQDRHFFDSQDEAEQWLKDQMTDNGIEYDADKLGVVLIILWSKYTG